RGVGRAEPAQLRRPDRRADPDHPLRAGPALPAGAGPAAVHRAQAARCRSGDARLPRRGARDVPQRPAQPPDRPVRGDPGLVGPAPVTPGADPEATLSRPGPAPETPLNPGIEGCAGAAGGPTVEPWDAYSSSHSPSSSPSSSPAGSSAF